MSEETMIFLEAVVEAPMCESEASTAREIDTLD